MITSGSPVDLNSDYMELITPAVNSQKEKKKKKKTLYRETKEGVHSTIRGKGHVSKLIGE